MASSEVPSKATIRSDLQRRLESVVEQMKEFDALHAEKRELEAALEALGGSPRLAGGDGSGELKPKKKRGTREEVEARRTTISEMHSSNLNLSINDVAEEVGANYQTAANDIKLLRDSGQWPQ